MIRAIRSRFALRALERAQADLNAYQSQPANGQWVFAVAYALTLRMERASRAYLNSTL